MKLKLSQKLLLLAILLFAISIRLYGLNWDQGYHLHPDERAIILYSLPLHFPSTIADFFSINSSWNPHFFAYGSFPIYLLKIATTIFSFFQNNPNTYDLMLFVGRIISVFFDTITIFFIFLLGKKIYNSNLGLLAAFFYAISVFPIQAAHFYAVDTLLTFFITVILFLLLSFYEKPRKKTAIFIGVLFGLSLATKDSALVLVFSFFTALSLDFFLIFIKSPHKISHWFPHIPNLIKKLFLYGILIFSFTFATFFIFEPYALIDFQSFWQQTLQQSAMTKSAFTFPYTLQYVGKIPYFYELKNIFIFGLGPILASFSFVGIFYISFYVWKNKNERTGKMLIIIISFFFIYFLTVGKFAIGFMRYMLPLYPIFCLSGSLIFYKFLIFIKIRLDRIKHHIFNKFLFFVLCSLLFALLFIWPLSFLHIYTKPNTRVTASNWINVNIPAGKTIAIEHWDDALPLFGGEKYKTLTLTLYDPDTPEKWEVINSQIKQTDYIIIASNRLYVPLMKLTNCQKLFPHPCYRQTAEYYKKLFDGSLGFKKVAEFTNYPTIPFLNIPINDQGADESFTVYDHPKVMIFQKIH